MGVPVVTAPDSKRVAAARLSRIMRALVMAWTNTDRRYADRHAIRTARLRATWPDLAAALDALASNSSLIAETVSHARCGVCGQTAEQVTADVDPRTATHVYRLAPCEHTTDRDGAVAAWENGATPAVTPVTGATLAAAEQRRQRVEEGHSPLDDLSHSAAELAWAAWAYIDRSASDAVPTDEVPVMWPFAAEDWKPEKSPLRMAIVAAALLLSDIDRRLLTGERP